MANNEVNESPYSLNTRTEDSQEGLIVDDIDEIQGDIAKPPNKRSKRRRVNKAEWKAKLNTTKRESGNQYLGKKLMDNKWVYNIPKGEKKLKLRCNCSLSKKLTVMKCNSITDEQRSEIFKLFWSLSWAEKKIYVKCNTELIDKQRNRQRYECSSTSSRRFNTIKYFLKISLNSAPVRVCKKMFHNTLNVPQGTILNWIKNKPSNDLQIPSTTAEPIVPNHNKRTLQRQNSQCAKLFLAELAKMESHYCRASTSKLYLEPNWHSKRELYDEYKDKWCYEKNVTPVSLTSFSNIFEDMNLSLFQPKKDECDTCVGYKTKNIAEDVYQNHIKRKNLARLEKQNDKEKCNQLVFTMDLQSVLLSPKSNVSSFYYKTKLAVHNFTLYDLKTSDGYCFLWHEAEGGLGSNEFTSIISYFLLTEVISNLINTESEIVLYSDGCSYQNRNSTLSNALVNISVEKNITIIQKYLEKGHTQMEADSMHSTIERKIKERTINVPADYVEICKNARTKPKPYQVKYLDHTFFKNYNGVKFYNSIRPGKKTGDPTVTQIRAIKYSPDKKIHYKLNFDDDWMELPQRCNSTLMSLNPINVPQLYNCSPKIKKEKFIHLQFLKKTLPSDYHSFYDQLLFE